MLLGDGVGEEGGAAVLGLWETLTVATGARAYCCQCCWVTVWEREGGAAVLGLWETLTAARTTAVVSFIRVVDLPVRYPFS